MYGITKNELLKLQQFSLWKYVRSGLNMCLIPLQKTNILALICWINYFPSSTELLFEYSYFIELDMTAVH